jgi:hypothetical protein
MMAAESHIRYFLAPVAVTMFDSLIFGASGRFHAPPAWSIVNIARLDAG